MTGTSEKRELWVHAAIMAVLGTAIAILFARFIETPLMPSLLIAVGLPEGVLAAAVGYQRLYGKGSRYEYTLDCGPHRISRLWIDLCMLPFIAALLFLMILIVQQQIPFLPRRFPELPHHVQIGCILASLVGLRVLWHGFLQSTKSLGHLLIREDGIWAYSRRIRWEQIKYCKWYFGCTMLVYLHGRFPFGGRIAIHIPMECRKRAVEELGKHCPVIE